MISLRKMCQLILTISYLDTGCKVRITFDNGATLAGRVLCVEYGDIPKENDVIIIEVDDGRLYAAIAARITDIEIV